MTATSTRRRRQANGRPNRVNVSLTDDQYKVWQAAADANDVTLQRWMVDQLEGKPPTQIRRALHAELTGIRAEIAGAMANLNQLAHRAHHEGIDLAGWLSCVAEITRQTTIVDDLAGRLS